MTAYRRKVYGFKRYGQTCFFDTNEQRDEALQEEMLTDEDHAEADAVELVEAFMSQEELDALPEFEGW